jgi:hypothetical protein
VQSCEGSSTAVRSSRVPAAPKVHGGRAVHTQQLVIGEWSLTAAAWTDRHQHEEMNWVREGVRPRGEWVGDEHDPSLSMDRVQGDRPDA